MKRALSAARSTLFPIIVGAIYFTAAGRVDVYPVWALLGVLVAFVWAMVFLADPTLAGERRKPGPGERDRVTQPLLLALFVVHWVVAGLDVGRWHVSALPLWAQWVGVGGYVVCLVVIFEAMRVNRFYSSAVRIQSERGHTVVSAGPYAVVRHPGYAASIVAFIAGGLAFGSGLALLATIGCAVIWMRRVGLEDRMLRSELPGYAEYAQRVRYRLLPGVY